MTSANFAAAQKRVLERRRLREAQTRSEIVNQLQLSHPVQDAFRKLPYPVNHLPTYGIYIWDTINGREGTAPSFRVGQVDAELLDEELLDLFKGQVGEGLKYFGVRLFTTHARSISSANTRSS
jgi:peroxin-2